MAPACGFFWPSMGTCAYFALGMRVQVCYDGISVRSTGGSSAVEQWTVKCALCTQLSIGREFKSPSPERNSFIVSETL